LEHFINSKFCFREYLETVCMHLYDMLRPLVIHMKHFETLVELCTVLRIEILQDYVYEDGNYKIILSISILLLFFFYLKISLFFILYNLKCIFFSIT